MDKSFPKSPFILAGSWTSLRKILKKCISRRCAAGLETSLYANGFRMDAASPLRRKAKVSLIYCVLSVWTRQGFLSLEISFIRCCRRSWDDWNSRDGRPKPRTPKFGKKTKLGFAALKKRSKHSIVLLEFAERFVVSGKVTSKVLQKMLMKVRLTCEKSSN
jgi:hypothetical protein